MPVTIRIPVYREEIACRPLSAASPSQPSSDAAKRPSGKRRRLVLAQVLRFAGAFVMALFVAVGMAAGVPGPASAQDGATQVGVDNVRQEPMKQTLPVIGRMVANQKGVVAARIKGPVARLNVKVGDRVKTGDVIAELVTDRLVWEREQKAALVQESEARLGESQAALQLAVQELDRLQSLRKSAAYSKARYDDKRQEVVRAQSSVAVARATVKKAKADLKLAEIDLRRAKILAPFPGVVSERRTEVGSYVDVGDPVVTIINDSALEIEADVPGSRIKALTPGMEVRIDITKDATYQAVVRAVVPDENPLTRTRLVRFTPKFPDGMPVLAANQSVILHLPIGAAREVVTVHKDAVLSRQGKTLVFVVEDGTAQLRPVALGEAIGGRFEVVDGLKPGDVVVVRGNERLRPGQKVTYQRTS